MKEFIKSVLKAWETSQKTNATNNGENTFIEIQKTRKVALNTMKWKKIGFLELIILHNDYGKIYWLKIN